MSGRDIPGLTADKLPLVLNDGSDTNGDVMTIVTMKKYTRPKELTTAWNPAAPLPAQAVSLDPRCSQCTKAFPNDGAMFQHWYVLRLTLSMVLLYLGTWYSNY